MSKRIRLAGRRQTNMYYGNHKMEHQEQPESNPVKRVKPGIYAVCSRLQRILALEEMKKAGNAPAGSDNGNTGDENTDTESQYQPVNVYILRSPLKYCHAIFFP